MSVSIEILCNEGGGMKLAYTHFQKTESAGAVVLKKLYFKKQKLLLMSKNPVISEETETVSY